MTERYVNIDCVSEMLWKSFICGPSYRRKSACSVKISIKYNFIAYHLEASTVLVDYSHSIDHKQMICIKFKVHKPY